MRTRALGRPASCALLKNMPTLASEARVISAHGRAACAFLFGVWMAIGFPPAMLGQEPGPIPPPPVRNPKPQQQRAYQQQAAKAQAQAVNQQARAALRALNASNLPAGLNLQRIAQLAHMSPDERAMALANLPPGARQRIEKGVENFAKWPPDEQARALSQYERLNELPPDRKELARESANALLNTPQPRKIVLANELAHLSSMTDQQRANYMSKPIFRSRYSESEIEMMINLRGIVP